MRWNHKKTRKMHTLPHTQHDRVARVCVCVRVFGFACIPCVVVLLLLALYVYLVVCYCCCGCGCDYGCFCVFVKNEPKKKQAHNSHTICDSFHSKHRTFLPHSVVCHCLLLALALCTPTQMRTHKHTIPLRRVCMRERDEASERVCERMCEREKERPRA